VAEVKGGSEACSAERAAIKQDRVICPLNVSLPAVLATTVGRECAAMLVKSSLLQGAR